MLPLQEVDDETDDDLLDSDLMDSDLFASLATGPTGGTDSTGGTHSTREPVAGEIQDAIEAGDWEAVGQTAAMLSGEDMDNATRESGSSRSYQSSFSGSTRGTEARSSGGGSDGSTYEDAARAAEIDSLVEGGDWDGVVAVAARYAEEADSAESDLISGRHSSVGRGYLTSSSGYPTSSNSGATSGATGNSRSSGTVSGITAPDTTTLSNHSSLVSRASSAGEETASLGGGSVGSVSVETADETTSNYSGSTRGGDSYMSRGTSMDTSRTSRDRSPETASMASTHGSGSLADSRSGSGSSASGAGYHSASTASGTSAASGRGNNYGYGNTPSPPQRGPPPPASAAGSSITDSHADRDRDDDLTSAGSTFTGTIGGPDPEEQLRKARRAEVEALVRRVVPDEIDNVDDIMVQFSGREDELIETLRAMQEKSIAQRARAAVQRSARVEGRAAGRTPEGRRGAFDDNSSAASGESGGLMASEASGGFDNRTVTTASGVSSVAGTSITEEFTEGGDDDDDDEDDGSRRSEYSSGTGSSSGYSSRGSYYSSDGDGGGGGGGSRARRSGKSRSSSGSDRKSGSGSGHRSARSGGSGANIDDLIDGGDWGGIISAANTMSGGHLSGDDSDLD